MFKVSFIALVLCGIISGCAGIFPSVPVVLTSCSYDQAWGIALASVNEFELRQVDKVGGKIEGNALYLFSFFHRIAQVTWEER